MYDVVSKCKRGTILEIYRNFQNIPKIEVKKKTYEVIYNYNYFIDTHNFETKDSYWRCNFEEFNCLSKASKLQNVVWKKSANGFNTLIV